MRFSNLIRCVLLCVGLHVGAASAIGTYIPAQGRVDMVYDDKRDIVYISSAGDVLRYRVQDGTFLSPVMVGGQLRGMDLSPDGNTLAIADADSSQTSMWVQLVDLSTLAVRRIDAPKAYMESGSWAVSFAYDNSLMVTSSFAGSGWVPLRRFRLYGKSKVIGTNITQNTMVAASGDRKVIAFAQSNISDGRWGRYNAASDAIVYRDWYTNGTSWFNYEIATNFNGSQYAIPTYGGTMIYDSAYTKVATFGTYAGPQPIGVAYHPVEHLAYFPWAQTSEVRVYDMDALAPVGSYDFVSTFTSNGNSAYQSGRTKLSADGSLLMVTVAGGVRILRMYPALSAQAISMRATPGMKNRIQLKGSIGNGGNLQYEIVDGPLHGSLLSSGSRVAYLPAAGYVGGDSFVYRVRYGRATADARVSISVGP